MVGIRVYVALVGIGLTSHVRLGRLLAPIDPVGYFGYLRWTDQFDDSTSKLSDDCIELDDPRGNILGRGGCIRGIDAAHLGGGGARHFFRGWLLKRGRANSEWNEQKKQPLIIVTMTETFKSNTRIQPMPDAIEHLWPAYVCTLHLLGLV